MKKHFYSEIVGYESLIIELDKANLSREEKQELVSLIDSNLYHSILDTILSELSEKDKSIFLQHLMSNEHNKIWDLLNEKIENIEEKIKKSADQIKQELHKDIREAKK